MMGGGCGKDSGSQAETATRERLVVLTFNLWHGLNPKGKVRFAEYDSPGEREGRRQCFIHHVRRLDPDVMFLEEVNPAPDYARRLARELNYDYTFVVDNSGLKIGSLGIPTNLRSGLAILAKKDLRLHGLGGRKLSGSFGWAGRWSSLQTKEFRYAAAGEIRVNGRRILLMGTHLHHGPEADAEIRETLAALVAKNAISQARADEIVRDFDRASRRRRQELEKAIAFARSFGMDQGAMLFAGDFNASPDAPELTWLKKDLGFRSVTADDDPTKLLMTWDYQRNPNTHFFADFVPVNEFEPVVMDALQPVIVKQTKRLDYIFHRGMDGWLVLRDSGLFANSPFEGRFCSDHFGIFAVFAKP